MIIRIFFVFSFILIGLIGCNENYNDEKKFNDFVESFNSKSDNLTFNVDRLSEDVILQQLSETKEKLKILRTIDINALEKESKEDYKFIESILVGKEIDLEEIQSWKRDPRDYMNFRQISNNYNSRMMTCEDKYDYLLEYLPVVLNDLKFAMLQIDTYVPRFQELGLYMAENSMSIFRLDIGELIYSCSGGGMDWEDM